MQENAEDTTETGRKEKTGRSSGALRFRWPFKVLVTMQTAQSYYESASVERCNLPRENPHILFVDGEATLCELLSLYLRSKGFEVTSTRSASEALTLMQQHTFALAVVGLNLEMQDGLDLLGLIKQKRPEVPVVVFIGPDADEALVRRALAGRASGFLRKAQSLESLASEVRLHLAPSLS